MTIIEEGDKLEIVHFIGGGENSMNIMVDLSDELRVAERSFFLLVY